MTKQNQHSFSFSQTAWKRLKKNKGAMFGLALIFLAILTGIFAYFIGTDSTPNADRQIVEVQAKKPGFTQVFLKVKKEKYIPPTNFFHRLIYGAEDKFNFIPVNSYRLQNDSVIIQKFIDEGVEDRMSFHISRLPQHTYIESKTFWLGTDRFGRDILSRLIVGIRVSLAVGLITVLISLTIGVILGSVAGYFR